MPSKRRAVIDNAYLVLLLAPLCWAGNHVLARGIVGHVPPGGLSVLRWLLATLILLPFAWPHLRRDWTQLVAKPWTVVFLALTGAGTFGTVQYVAAQWASALNMSVLNSVAPIMILLASRVLFGDRLGWPQLIGVSISFSGVVVIATQGDLGRLLGLAFEKGDMIVLANMGLWALYCACLRLRPDVHWLSFTVALAVLALIANVPYAAWEYRSGQSLQATWLTLLAVAYAALCTSVLAYASWNRGVELIGAPRAGAFLHLIPIYGTILAVAILGETVQAFHLAGFVLILLGVWLAAQPQRVARA